MRYQFEFFFFFKYQFELGSLNLKRLFCSLGIDNYYGISCTYPSIEIEFEIHPMHFFALVRNCFAINWTILTNRMTNLSNETHHGPLNINERTYENKNKNENYLNHHKLFIHWRLMLVVGIRKTIFESCIFDRFIR